MRENDTRLADWAIGKVTAEFKDDVCLLLEHRTLKLPGDEQPKTFSYYIPATTRANGLARAFIIDHIGYDLFPMSWERIENIADLKEYNTTCLADAEILWAKSDYDRRRFTGLQKRLQANLQNPQYMHTRALKWVDTVMEIYQETLFEERIYKVRQNAGYICDFLSLAVAFVNQKYFKHGQTDQLAELQAMQKTPEDFITLYQAIVAAKAVEEQKALCHTMIKNTREFLKKNDGSVNTLKSKPDFSELASWYQELIYTWRRVAYWCKAQNPVNAYMWGCMLQEEIDRVGGEFGVTEVDILGSFDAGDLMGFQKQTGLVEQAFIKAIDEHGVKLDSYDSIDEFLAL